MTDPTGGIPVAPGGTPGGLVTGPGQVQYGDMLLGSGTPAGWRELVGWRALSEATTADTPRPQAHGAYPGAVYAEPAVVTFTFLLRGTPEDKMAALATIEQYAPVDGVERALTVDDGDGAWLRMARLVGREVPQGVHFRHAPVECSLQFLCADPRRYRVDEMTAEVRLPVSSGGLEYALVYPLSYGTDASGGVTVHNEGSTATPPVVEFVGPLTNPVLTAPDWTLGFNITLADGERLTCDTGAGTVLLNGTADRLYTIRTTSSPLERCTLPPGSTALTLVAPSGTGRVEVTYRHARL